MEPELMEELKEKVFNLIGGFSFKDFKILLLSLTGSRAFGWGGRYYDWDIHGIFHAENFFDYIHSGKEGMDLNLWDISNIFIKIERKHWTVFEDLSNPIFVSKIFDHEEFLSLGSAENVKIHMPTIENEFLRALRLKNIRQALHGYRLLLEPLYFLKTRKIETYIPKVNDEIFGSKIFMEMCKAYSERKNIPVDWNKVKEEYEILYEMLKELLAKRLDDPSWLFDEARYRRWKEKLLKKLNE